MRFINASMMPNLDRHVQGEVTAGESVWQRECWNGANPDYSEIDDAAHAERAREVGTDIEVIHLMHERGAGTRQYYDIMNHTEEALELYNAAALHFRNACPWAAIGFYDQYDPVRQADIGLDALDGLNVDYLMPSAYLKGDLTEFAATINYQVAWLRARSRLPIYLCAWHMTKPRGVVGDDHSEGWRYMSPAEMDGYLDALQLSGADGVLWWASSDEGIRGDEQSHAVGTTNNALLLKAWNHPYRYGEESSYWVEAFRNYHWA